MESEVKLFIYGIILILVPTITVNAGKYNNSKNKYNKISKHFLSYLMKFDTQNIRI